MVILNTCKQLLLADETNGIQDGFKVFCTSHMMRSMMLSSFCKSKIAQPSYSLCKITKFFMNAFCTKVYNALYCILVCAIMLGFFKLGHI